MQLKAGANVGAQEGRPLRVAVEQQQAALAKLLVGMTLACSVGPEDILHGHHRSTMALPGRWDWYFVCQNRENAGSALAAL